MPVTEQEKKVRFSCTSCGYAIKYAHTPKLTIYVNGQGQPKYGRLLHRNAPIDPFFGFDLWYRITTNDGLLWAYNIEHLTVIEAYIADTLRERNNVPYRNNSLASRMPKWASAARNREHLLKSIVRAKEK